MEINWDFNVPVSGCDLPLVVISHGNGSGSASHVDLAHILANAGYVVAALMHSSDDYADQSAVGSVSWLSRRNSELHTTVDYMLKNWQGHGHTNSQRVDAFGFSAGGFTILTAVGAQSDLRLIAKHCIESPEFVCDLLRSVSSPYLNVDTPMMGEAFPPTRELRRQLGRRRRYQRFVCTNTKLIREELGSWVEFHSVAGAVHCSFLTPC